MKNDKGFTPLEKATGEAESGSAGTRDGMTTTSLSCWLVQHPSGKDSRQAGMTEGGFTLIELIIAMTVILIVSLGFFGWATTIIQTNLSIERNNTAYAMLMDVAERLQRMSDNQLICTKNGWVGSKCTLGNKKCVGFDDGTDKDSDGQVFELNGCSGSNPSVNITSTAIGVTTYTNPIRSSNTPYLYDNDKCAGETWVTSACRTGSTITTGANASIDHPNSTAVTTYDSIDPIRSYRNTTYYAVWSVAYMPCNAGTDTSRRKIFVTVYWIDPEPTADNVGPVQTGIGNGTYAVKSVSVVVDKSIGTEG